MKSAIRKLRMHALKLHLEASRGQCEALAQEFESATTTEQKTELARRWDRAMQVNHAAQLALSLLEKQEIEDQPAADHQSRTC